MSAESGVAPFLGRGLGVVIADFDDDGWPEVFVANDSMPNFLFRRTGQWRYEEVALRSGVAVASDGRSRAGMGTDAADYDGDGRLDLVVTNLDYEMYSLYRGLGRQLFAYATPESGIGPATLPFVGFGVVFFDFDNDMQLDLAFANGHIIDHPLLRRAGSTHGQRNLLFRYLGSRRFENVTTSAGPGFALEKVSRGLAAGDFDNDGDLDLLVTNNGQTADLLRNNSDHGNALIVRLVGKESSRDGIGARLRLTTGTVTQMREVKAGSSYLAQNDLRQHFGLGTNQRVDRLEVRWPSGATTCFPTCPQTRSSLSARVKESSEPRHSRADGADLSAPVDRGGVHPCTGRPRRNPRGSADTAAASLSGPAGVQRRRRIRGADFHARQRRERSEIPAGDPRVRRPVLRL
jgi:hypothetical protein